jgi:hypothetical protein
MLGQIFSGYFRLVRLVQVMTYYVRFVQVSPGLARLGQVIPK